MFKLKSILRVDFLNRCNLEVNLKYTFYTYVFMFKLRSIQGVDFPN